MKSIFKVLSLIALLNIGDYALGQDNKPSKPRYEQVKRKSVAQKKFNATNEKNSNILKRDTVNAKNQ